MNQHNYNILDTADAVARAAHIWIRSLWLDESRADEERQALAGGLLAGLCDRLDLSPRVQEIVAYIYTLLDDDSDDALALSRSMMNAQSAEFRRAFAQGRSEAGAILEMLAYHER